MIVKPKVEVISLDQKLSKLQQENVSVFLIRAIKLARFLTPSFQKDEHYTDYPPFFPDNAKIIKSPLSSLNGSNTITLRYPHRKDMIFDCKTTPIMPHQMMQSMFYITSNNELACCALVKGVPDLENSEVLIEGVEAMQIRYGEDVDNKTGISRFVPSTSLSFDYNRVRNIRISLLIRTPEKAKTLVETPYYTLQNTEIGPMHDNYVRRIYTTTIQLKDEEHEQI